MIVRQKHVRIIVNKIVPGATGIKLAHELSDNWIILLIEVKPMIQGFHLFFRQGVQRGVLNILPLCAIVGEYKR